MSEPRESRRRVAQWVEKAEHDLRTAEHTLTLKEDCPFDTVCFHAQQCVEKYLKGFLAFKSIDFPNTHDLVILLRLVTEAVRAGIEIGGVEPLNRYTIEARYPGDWEAITRDEAERAMALARSVRDAIRARLPKEALGERG